MQAAVMPKPGAASKILWVTILHVAQLRREWGLSGSVVWGRSAVQAARSFRQPLSPEHAVSQPSDISFNRQAAMAQSESRIWKIFWWSYFAVLAITTVSSWFGIRSVSEVLLAVVDGYALVGLWGYLRQVSIGWRKFWVVYFALFTAYAVYGIGQFAWLAWQSHAAMYYAMTVGAVLLIAPQYWALWRYAFRSTAIWQTTQAAA